MRNIDFLLKLSLIILFVSAIPQQSCASDNSQPPHSSWGWQRWLVPLVPAVSTLAVFAKARYDSRQALLLKNKNEGIPAMINPESDLMRLISCELSQGQQDKIKDIKNNPDNYYDELMFDENAIVAIRTDYATEQVTLSQAWTDLIEPKEMKTGQTKLCYALLLMKEFNQDKTDVIAQWAREFDSKNHCPSDDEKKVALAQWIASNIAIDIGDPEKKVQSRNSATSSHFNEKFQKIATTAQISYKTQAQQYEASAKKWHFAAGVGALFTIGVGGGTLFFTKFAGHKTLKSAAPKNIWKATQAPKI